jgi:hypothetical protein
LRAIDSGPPAVSQSEGCCLPLTVIVSAMQPAVETRTAGACLLVAVNRSVKVTSGAGHDRPARAAVGAGGRPLRNTASLAMTAAEVNVRVTWCGRAASGSAEMVTARKLAGSRCSAAVRYGSQAANA